MYEINVALNGRHFFSTHERSLTDKEHAIAVYSRLVKAFPASAGFDIRVLRMDTQCYEVSFNVEA